MDFIAELNHDITAYKKIKSNAKLFIAHKNLRPVKLPQRKPQEKDLPTQATVGDIYLIKGDSIIQYYSYWENLSLHTQVNFTKPLWICRIDIINAAPGDPEHLRFMLEGCEVLYNIETAHYSMLGFLEAGFQLYKTCSNFLI